MYEDMVPYRLEHNSPQLKCGQHPVTFFKKAQCRNRENRSNFIVLKPDKYHLTQGSKSASAAINVDNSYTI